jgi:hypothetical protein
MAHSLKPSGLPDRAAAAESGMRAPPAATDDSQSQATNDSQSRRAVSTALAIAGLPASPKGEPFSDANKRAAEERTRKHKKTQVLSRKAMERTEMLQKSSLRRIDAGKALVSDSSEREARSRRSGSRRSEPSKPKSS